MGNYNGWALPSDNTALCRESTGPRKDEHSRARKCVCKAVNLRRVHRLRDATRLSRSLCSDQVHTFLRFLRAIKVNIIHYSTIISYLGYASPVSLLQGRMTGSKGFIFRETGSVPVKRRDPSPFAWPFAPSPFQKQKYRPC